MTHVHDYWTISRRSLVPAVAAALTIAIFVADTLTDLEIAVAVFYVLVVLLSASFLQRRGVILAGATCIGLTLLSFVLTRSGAPFSGLVNCLISICAIAATTYLVLEIDSARATIDETRAQLAHVGRVTTLGELTTSIAHEVNQPLAAIATNGEAALRWLGGDAPNLAEAGRALERIVREAHRASEIVGRIRGLARNARTEMRAFDLNETVAATLGLAQREIQRQGIAVHAELEPDLPRAHGDQVQLQQVILNLLFNAVEAIVRSGHIGEIFVRTKREDNRIIVAVADTSADGLAVNFDRLFDAFYTTKPQGLGMGLAISRSIMEAHGGRIWADVNRPRGLIVQFALPLQPSGRHPTDQGRSA
jgi:C4-dicarboxylate-specific signal transduction histidine kinase